MPTYAFYIYSVDVLSYNVATDAFVFDGDYQHWEDRYRIDVDDDDAAMNANGDANQNAIIYDSDNNVVDSGNIFVPAYAAVDGGGGSTIFLDRIEVDGVHYGYISSVPLVPGTSYPLTNSDTFEDSHTYYETFSAPCFGPDTMIDTVDGPRQITQLRQGDGIVTYDHGIQPVVWAGSRRVSHIQAMIRSQNRPVRFSGGMRGLNTPTRPLTMSRQHRVLLRHPFVELVTDTNEVFVPARLLGDGYIPSGPLDWHHVLLPNHEIIRANGVWVESLFAGDALPDILAPDQYGAAVRALGTVNRHPVTARPCLQLHEAAFLLARLRTMHTIKSRNKRVA